VQLPWAAPVRRVRQEHGLAIRVEADNQFHRIALEGELDLSNRDALEEEMEEIAAAEPGPSVLLVDLSELQFIDSCGIASLVRAAERSRDGGPRLEIIHGPEPVRRVFKIAGLAELLPFRDAPGSRVAGQRG
jgi:anti-anti-sigma factor